MTADPAVAMWDATLTLAPNLTIGSPKPETYLTADGPVPIKCATASAPTEPAGFVHRDAAGKWTCTRHGRVYPTVVGDKYGIRFEGQTAVCGVCTTPPAPPREPEPVCTIAQPLDCHRPEPEDAVARHAQPDCDDACTRHETCRSTLPGPDAYDLADAIDRLLTEHRWDVTLTGDPHSNRAWLDVTDHDDPAQPKTYTVTVTPGAPQAEPSAGWVYRAVEKIAERADPDARRCPTPGCVGDARYAAPGRGHDTRCRYPYGPPEPDTTCGRADCDDHIVTPEPATVECDLAALAPEATLETPSPVRALADDVSARLSALPRYASADDVAIAVAKAFRDALTIEAEPTLREDLATAEADRDAWKEQVVGVREQQRAALARADEAENALAEARAHAIAACVQRCRAMPDGRRERRETLAVANGWPEWLTAGVEAAL